MKSAQSATPNGRWNIAEVKAATDLVDVVSNHGVELRQSGSEFVGLCPFHDDTTPSFNVNRDKQVYHCFGCGAKGDVIRFEQKISSVPLPEALSRLAQRGSPGSVIGNGHSSPSKQRPQTPGRKPMDYRESRSTLPETDATSATGRLHAGCLR